ncbi:MAG: iron-containing alcohol dehydrogenase, partial [Actinobacteria bacterium]|nr:iron-containing alcohol dehydrogenase [Actinomycetota bacterium]
MGGFVHDSAPMRVVFGAGSLDTVPAEVDRLGASRVLLVAGGPEAAYADLLADALGARLAGRFSDVVMHVPVEVARSAADAAATAGADLVVCVGGGSSTGAAKAIALASGLPILAVPTTYAGSEMTTIWGLTENGVKTTGRDPRVQPRVVVYDPELTLSLPVDLSAASGMNAMAHL